MFGNFCPKLKHRLLIFCLSSIFVFVWLVPTAVAQSTQTGTITGTVHNGTSDAPAAEGTQVTLHAYNSSYTTAETFTTSLDADGRFEFTLNDKPADWVYMVSTDYQEFSFSSTIAPLAGEPTLDLSLTIYETTNDSENVVIDQLEITLTSIDKSVQVSELYSFANMGTAVYVGNNNQEGVQISLPAAAQTPTFEQGMGPSSGFFPMNEVVEGNGRWHIGTSLRPGPNSLTLRVTYIVPATALNISRTLPYQTNAVLLAVPDDFEFVNSEWQQQATQSIGERGVLRQYNKADFAAGSSLQLAIEPVTTRLGTNADSYIENGNWLLSLIILSFMATLAFRLLKPGSAPTLVPQLATSAGSVTLQNNEKSKEERWKLLFALADLDSAYKNGKLSEEDYQRQRQDIKSRLRDIWEVA